jgi:hypothetical protein
MFSGVAHIKRQLDNVQAITVFKAVKALCVRKFPAETPNLAIDIAPPAASASRDTETQKATYPF